MKNGKGVNMEKITAYKSLNGQVYTDLETAKQADKRHLIHKHFINNMNLGRLQKLFDSKDFKKAFAELNLEIEARIEQNIDSYIKEIQLKKETKQLLTDNKKVIKKVNKTED